MSERYVSCDVCADVPCGCGHSGNAIAYLESQLKQEWEREYVDSRENMSGEWGARSMRIENAFYKDPTPTKALDAAVSALINAKTKHERKYGI